MLQNPAGPHHAPLKDAVSCVLARENEGVLDTAVRIERRGVVREETRCDGRVNDLVLAGESARLEHDHVHEDEDRAKVQEQLGDVRTRLCKRHVREASKDR